MQLISQSVFGGDAVVAREVDAGLRYNTRFTGAVIDEVVAVVVDAFFGFISFRSLTILSKNTK